MAGWSAALRLKTRRVLDGIDPFPASGLLPMKDSNNFSAYLKQTDLLNGQIILYDTASQVQTSFQSAGEMFDAGWIADLCPAPKLSLLSSKKITAEQQSHPAANKIEALRSCNAKERK